MAKFVPDIKTRRWVIIAPGRRDRPLQVAEAETKSQIVKKSGFWYRKDCPFCLGNESLTPPEVYRKKDNGSWLVRVVPNKFPVTDIHEVVIHSPDHKLDFAELTLSHAEAILKTYRKRYLELSGTGQVLIFNNKGVKAGESLLHPHSQIVVFPKQISLDVLSLEPTRNIILEGEAFTTFCPDFSQWPYEIWIAHKKCCGGEAINFGQTTDKELAELTQALQKILQKLLSLFPDLSYNFYISPGAFWYLRIIPRIGERAGLELGTGLSVNWVDPVNAAEGLKQ